MSISNYFVALSENDLRVDHRRWNGNDEKGRQTHHGVIRLNESPVDLRLSWTGLSVPSQIVGSYRLDLHNLLRNGFIRPDREPGKVRRKFVRDGNSVYIRVRQSAPSLCVGTLAFGAPRT
jgi:hypothetical protein